MHMRGIKSRKNRVRSFIFAVLVNGLSKIDGNSRTGND